ncbi:transglutaminase family protein [Flavobacterium sp. 7A]|uniref:transglutaminase family protein n=1 Tax=Flavobacterium sp. 7A TaxID=2940571 RepID=UPI002225CF53|nr:transglutaminase family protein [Flavobacterium sp. 7A]MCW2118279.1 transglutaminase-like putative cysteine protease [Flavobacterium sp. 7A]
MAVFKIVHITKYQYNWPIKESVNEIRLYPYNFANQDVLQFQLSITNNPEVAVSTDNFGNQVGNFSTLESHTELVIESRIVVRVNHSLKIPEIDHDTLEDLTKEKEKSIALLRYSYPDVITKQNIIDEILDEIGTEDKSIVMLAQECSSYIYNRFTYSKGITTIYTTLDEILVTREGVCQDFAHVLLQLMRTKGIPARYVSGYICPNKVGLRGEGATHAWVEIYSPTQGWLGIDPTNNIWTMDNHVKLSVGLNFADCSPVKGTFKGIAVQSLSVFVSIGYEDGRHFEEFNDVQLEEIPEDVKAQLEYIEQARQQHIQQQ